MCLKKPNMQPDIAFDMSLSRLKKIECIHVMLSTDIKYGKKRKY